jgi:hypothetical protein
MLFTLTKHTLCWWIGPKEYLLSSTARSYLSYRHTGPKKSNARSSQSSRFPCKIPDSGSSLTDYRWEANIRYGPIFFFAAKAAPLTWLATSKYSIRTNYRDGTNKLSQIPKAVATCKRKGRERGPERLRSFPNTTTSSVRDFFSLAAVALLFVFDN